MQANEPNPRMNRIAFLSAAVLSLSVGIAIGWAGHWGLTEWALRRELAEPRGQGSFAIGAQMARNLKATKIEVHRRSVCAGLETELRGEASRLVSTELGSKGLAFLHQEASTKQQQGQSSQQGVPIQRSRIEGEGGFVQSQFGFRYRNEQNLPEQAIEQQLSSRGIDPTISSSQAVRLVIEVVDGSKLSGPNSSSGAKVKTVQLTPTSLPLIKFLSYLRVLKKAQVQFDEAAPVEELRAALELPKAHKSPPFAWIFSVARVD